MTEHENDEPLVGSCEGEMHIGFSKRRILFLQLAPVPFCDLELSLVNSCEGGRDTDLVAIPGGGDRYFFRDGRFHGCADRDLGLAAWDPGCRG